LFIWSKDGLRGFQTINRHYLVFIASNPTGTERVGL
jgi:hypothetical protein